MCLLYGHISQGDAHRLGDPGRRRSSLYGRGEHCVCVLRTKHIPTLPQAESKLSILGTETSSQSPPAVSLRLPECLDSSEADIIVRASDSTSFPVHKSVLASSSWVFRDMFTLPWPPNNEMTDGLPVVDISEDAELVRSLITMLYPIPSEMPASYDRVLTLLAAAYNYDMDAVQSSIRAEVEAHGPSPTVDGAQAFRAYAIASSSGLTPEMEMAARLTLDQPMTFEHLRDELQWFEGWALRELARFRKACRDNLVSCIKSFLDIKSGPSEIWAGCPLHVSCLLPALPSLSRSLNDHPYHDQAKNFYHKLPWLHNLFTPLIDKLNQAFKSPLIEPSSIREKYLDALRKHAAPDHCTFCLGVHAMKGDWYCAQLEQALDHALEEASATFTFRSIQGPDHVLRLSKDAGRFCLDIATPEPGPRNYSVEGDSGGIVVKSRDHS